MTKQKTVSLDGKQIPCNDVLKAKPVMVSDTLYTEFTYRLFEPCYHEVKTLVPRDKAYKLELAVRKAKNS